MPRRLAEELARAFGLPVDGARLSEQAAGTQGGTFRLETTLGGFAAKRLRRGVDTWRTDHSAVLQLAALDAGVPTPRPRKTIEGRFVADIGGRVWRMSEWRALAPRTSALTPAETFELGISAARLHRAGSPVHSRPDAWYANAPSPDSWRALGARAAQLEVAWAEQLRSLEPDIAAYVRIVTAAEPRPCRWAHRDLGPANICRDSAGGLVVIDWDSAGPAVVEYEFARLLVEFAVAEGRPDAELASALISGYAAGGGTRAPMDISAFTMHCAAWLNHLHAMLGASLRPIDDADDRETIERWCERLLRGPVPQSVLTDLVRLVADLS